MFPFSPCPRTWWKVRHNRGNSIATILELTTLSLFRDAYRQRCATNLGHNLATDNLPMKSLAWIQTCNEWSLSLAFGKAIPGDIMAQHFQNRPPQEWAMEAKPARRYETYGATGRIQYIALQEQRGAFWADMLRQRNHPCAVASPRRIESSPLTNTIQILHLLVRPKIGWQPTPYPKRRQARHGRGFKAGPQKTIHALFFRIA